MTPNNINLRQAVERLLKDPRALAMSLLFLTPRRCKIICHHSHTNPKQDRPNLDHSREKLNNT